MATLCSRRWSGAGDAVLSWGKYRLEKGVVSGFFFLLHGLHDDYAIRASDLRRWIALSSHATIVLCKYAGAGQMTSYVGIGGYIVNTIMCWVTNYASTNRIAEKVWPPRVWPPCLVFVCMPYIECLSPMLHPLIQSITLSDPLSSVHMRSHILHSCRVRKWRYHGNLNCRATLQT